MFKWLRREKKSNEDVVGFFDNAFNLWLESQSGWRERSPERFSREGYVENVIVGKCVKEIATGVATLDWIVYNDEVEVDDAYPSKNSPEYNLFRLVKRPNPRQSWKTLIQVLESYKQIAGNSYLWAVRNGESEPTELHVIPPQNIKVIGGSGIFPERYEMIDPENKNRVIRVFPVNAVNGMCDLLHVKFFNPLNRFVGLSPLEQAAFSVDVHNESNLWSYKLLKNDTRPSGVLSFDGLKLNSEQRQQIKQNLADAYSGAANTGKPLVLEGSATWQQLGMSPKDLDFIEGKSSVARDIATAYRVPPILVNLGQDATFSNQEEARLALHEDTILPEAHDLSDELTHWLVPMFVGTDSKIKIVVDDANVGALEKRNASKWDRINSTTFLTINEKRSLFGYEPLTGEQYDTIA